MAGQVTYKDLFTQVVEEIEKRKAFPGTNAEFGNQLGHASVAPLALAANSQLLDVQVADLIRAVQNLIRDTIPGTIIEGLIVEATDPVSEFVIVNPGTGSVAGRLYELDAQIELEIPFDLDTEVWFLNMFQNHIEIEANQHPEKLTIAKIVVPEPGNPQSPPSLRFVLDQRDTNSLDAYIVNLRQTKLFDDGKGKLEEDSVDFLRDNIGDLLADNLIGNIRLSENLKIINTAGTAVLDSNSLKLYSPNQALLLAKFDQRGTFFYNSSGIELARFSVDGAHVGNIVINTDSIQSGDFTSGALGKGFQIKDDGDAEFNNVFVRGKISTSVFEKQTISVVGGNLLVLDADILEEDMTVDDDSILVISGDTTLSVGDILRIKDAQNDEWFEVLDTVSGVANGYLVERDKAGIYTTDNNPAWTAGTTVSVFGQNGEGGLFLTASESNAPFLSVFTHSGEPWTDLLTHLRLGNLNGFLGETTDLFGIAIGNDNEFLKYDPLNGLRIKGDITVTAGNVPVVFYQDDEPASGSGVKEGDIWVDTNNNNTISTFQGGIWRVAQDLGITVFKQGGSGVPPPTSLHAGDLWYDTDAERTYRAAIAGADETVLGEWEQLIPNGLNASGSVISNVLAGAPVNPPANPGLFLGSDFMGFYDGNDWTVFIQNNGNFGFRGDGTNFITWDGATLTIRGLLDADNIVTGFLNAARIAAGSIAADKLTVSELSAITADMGTLTAGSITGALIRTAASGRRIELNSDGLFGFDASGNRRFGFFLTSLAGQDPGDVLIGDKSTNKFLEWDDSAGVLNVRGLLSADDINTGTLNASFITAGTIIADNIGTDEVTEKFNDAVPDDDATVAFTADTEITAPAWITQASRTLTVESGDKLLLFGSFQVHGRGSSPFSAAGRMNCRFLIGGSEIKGSLTINDIEGSSGSSAIRSIQSAMLLIAPGTGSKTIDFQIQMNDGASNWLRDGGNLGIVNLKR